MPADDLVEQRGVEDGPGDRAGLVEGVRQGHEAVARDPAVRRLHADRAGDRARLADRAAGVGADRQRCLVRRDRGRAAAAGAARDAAEVPRVVGRAVGAVLGGGAHRELVHVGLAEDRQAGRAQPGDDRGVVRRHPALEDPRPAGRGQPTGGEHVLDRDRYAVQRARRRPGGAALVGRRGVAERSLGVDLQEGVHGAVDLGDPVEVGLGDLDAGRLARRQRVGDLGGGAPVGALTARPRGSSAP